MVRMAMVVMTMVSLSVMVIRVQETFRQVGWLQQC